MNNEWICTCWDVVRFAIIHEEWQDDDNDSLWTGLFTFHWLKNWFPLTNLSHSALPFVVQYRYSKSMISEGFPYMFLFREKVITSPFRQIGYIYLSFKQGYVKLKAKSGGKIPQQKKNHIGINFQRRKYKYFLLIKKGKQNSTKIISSFEVCWKRALFRVAKQIINKHQKQDSNINMERLQTRWNWNTWFFATFTRLRLRLMMGETYHYCLKKIKRWQWLFGKAWNSPNPVKRKRSAAQMRREWLKYFSVWCFILFNVWWIESWIKIILN